MADNVHILVATYDSLDGAEADYTAIRELHAAGIIGSYDAAVITKDASGKVHVRKREKPTQHGAWSGLAIGALVGLLFPPSILAGGVVGAAAGGLVGHLWKGMSRRDMKDLGEALDEGQASLVVIGESKVEHVIQRELQRAAKTYEKQIDADARQLRTELDQATAHATA